MFLTSNTQIFNLSSPPTFIRLNSFASFMPAPPTSSREKTLAHLALLSVAIIYGLTYFVVGVVFTQIPPLGTVALRAVFAVIFFGILSRWVVRERIRDRQDYIRLFFCGMTGIALNQAFFFWGLSHTTPIHGAVLMTTSPLFVFIAAFALRTERLSPLKILGLIMAFIGALTLTVKGQDIGLAPNMLLGDAMILLNAASYGVYLVLVRPLMQKYQPLTIVFWIYVFGAMFNIPAGLPDLLTVSWGGLTSTVWLALGFVLLFLTAGTYLLNGFALSKLPSSAVGTYIYLQPVFVAFFSLFWADGQLDALTIGCMGLVMLGVWAVAYRKKNN